MKKLKFWIFVKFISWLEILISHIYFKRWLKIRDKSIDKDGNKLCYCGHTYKCSCANPDKQLFLDSVKRKTIILTDKDNGWKNCQQIKMRIYETNG